MDEKTGQNASAISLPKGGGAIKGIGETFQPNLFTGTGNISVPIYASPGRNGFGPKLNLQYSSGNGNGPFGLGWKLSIPRITRKTEKGLPTYTDKDIFVMSGAEDLVPHLEKVSGDTDRWEPKQYEFAGYTIARYRPRTEGLFARIERWGKAGDVHWRATTKENVTSVYGRTPSARVVDPDDPKHVYEWLLEETFDAKGNHILYEYVRERQDPGVAKIYEQNRKHAQVYIRRILYGNTPDGLPDDKKCGATREGTHHREHADTKDRQYLFEVLFDYGDLPSTPSIPYDWPREQEGATGENWLPRPDPFSSFRARFELRTLRRCKRVLMLHHFKEGELIDAPLVKSTDFEYESNKDTRISFLASVKVQGYRKKFLFRADWATYSSDMGANVLSDALAQEFHNRGVSLLPNSTLRHCGKLGDVWQVTHEDEDTRYFLIKINGALEVYYYVFRDMPPVTFKYSEFEPEKQRYESVIANANDYPPRSLSDPNFALMDVFGDGLPDILHTTETGFHYWQNVGDARIARRHPQHEIPAGVTLSQPNVSVGDMGGDGLPDLVVEAPPISGFYEAKPDGNWRRFKRFDKMPSIGLADPNGRLVDLTGDGLSDFLVTRDHHFLWYHCQGEEGYDNAKFVERKHDLNEFPDVYFNEPAGRVRLADMTGDGLNDIVMVHSGRIDYWPNLGYGRFGNRITMEKAPHFDYNFDPKRLSLVDLDGTGCADLVYVDFNQVHFWFNRSGNTCSEKHTISGTPYAVDSTAVQIADFFGTGTACLVWSYDFNYQLGGNYKVLDFCGGEKPHLLVKMSNNMGATTRADYASSTKFYLEDKKNGNPWVTNLPFPIQVLEKTEVIDHISKTKLVTNYKYHHGYYDGREREFRGFGRVDQYDTEEFETFSKAGLHAAEDSFENGQKAFHVPPVLTKNWFHTGVYFDDNLRSANGKPYDKQDMIAAYREEFYQGDHRAFAMAGNTVVPNDTTPPHEAHRALRGALIRSEVYAIDSTDKANHPYTVTENRYEVRELQARHTNPHAVFLSVTKETLSYHYEREPADPRIGQTLNLAYDDYGNITQSVSIGYPRRRPLTAFEDGDGNPILGPDGKPIAPYPEQRELKATYTFSDFIYKDDDPGFYYVSVPCQTQVFEVHGLDWAWPPADELLPESLKPLEEAVFHGLEDPNDCEPFENDPPADLSTPKKRLVDWKRSYFRRDEAASEVIDNSGQLENRLDLCEIQSLALPYESYQVAFNESHLQQLFEDRLNGLNLVGEGGYHEEDDHWWIPTGRQGFNADKFFMVERAADPFGNTTETVLDDYALLTTEVNDALPEPRTNITRARNDYRTLQSYDITDPNRNRSQVAFDALGLVVGTAVMGLDENDTPIAGDDLIGFESDLSETVRDDHIADPLGSDPHAILKNATTRLVYDLKRYQVHGEPNVVYTLARETHSKDQGGTPSNVQHSFVYSDGFGREAQSKVQAEPGPLVEGGAVVESRWVGTGTKVYNNKGKPVRQYEPFFSGTHVFGVEQHGISPTLFYDPLVRVVCTVHPNHTYEKVVFDPWHKKAWDVNDTIHPSYQYDSQDTHEFTVVDPPGSTHSFAHSNNNAGQIAGNYADSQGDYHGFLRDGAGFTTIDVPGAAHTRGGGINNTGQIVGLYIDNDNGVHGYLLDGVDFSTIDHSDMAHTSVREINDAGQIVGSYENSSGINQGFLLEDGNFKPIIDLPNATSSYSLDINNAQQIVGVYSDPNSNFHGFLLADDTFKVIEYPGATQSGPFGINDTGQKIVGLVENSSDDIYGFVLDQDVFSRIDFPHAIETYPESINDAGQIVGYYKDGSKIYHGFLADPKISPYENFSPVDDEDIGHYLTELPAEEYLPTWHNMRTIEEYALTLWPDKDEDGKPLPEPIRIRNRKRREGERRAAILAARHSATPSVEYLDVLGRTFLTVADNGKDQAKKNNYIKTHVTLDIEGNDKIITDPRGIQAFKHQFDIAGRKLVVQSVDAGTKHTLLNALNNPIHAWDAEDYHTRLHYDPLQRPTELKVKKGDTGDWVLKEVTVYGESKATTPEKTNHRGQIWKVYDGAGLVLNEHFDFKGNLNATTRRLLADGTSQVSWPLAQESFDENQALQLLEPESESYTVQSEFDALNRVIRQKDPDGTVQETLYNEANLLEKLFVTVDGDRREYVKNIDYNEKGQRTEIKYLNDVTTKYTYDSATFRLTELTSVRKGTHANKCLQGLVYVYDPVGNIASIADFAHKDIFNHNDKISAHSDYQYDPIYRLIQAQGREHENMTACHYQQSDKKHTEIIQLTNQPISNGQSLTNYMETYKYDDSGNIEVIHHQNTTLGTAWKRVQNYELNDPFPSNPPTPKSNRIAGSRAGCTGEDTFKYAHDKNGNIMNLVHLPEMISDQKNQLIDVQLNVAATPNRAYYQYDAGGQRVRKIIVKNNDNITEEHIYIGDYEIFYKKNNAGGITFRRDTNHVTDDTNRIALIETEKDASGNATDTPRVRFQLANHLGSSVLEVDDSENADIISYEEYYPYGGTAYIAGRDDAETKRKRYRYSGKERDDETGLYYYGARYYAPWLARWISCDPILSDDSLNIFGFLSGNPIINKDQKGLATESADDIPEEAQNLYPHITSGGTQERYPADDPRSSTAWYEGQPGHEFRQVPYDESDSNIELPRGGVSTERESTTQVPSTRVRPKSGLRRLRNPPSRKAPAPKAPAPKAPASRPLKEVWIEEAGAKFKWRVWEEAAKRDEALGEHRVAKSRRNRLKQTQERLWNDFIQVMERLREPDKWKDLIDGLRSYGKMFEHDRSKKLVEEATRFYRDNPVRLYLMLHSEVRAATPGLDFESEAKPKWSELLWETASEWNKAFTHIRGNLQ